MTQPRITAAICTYQRSAILKGALDSLSTQNLADPATAEVLVVDNGSSDNTSELAASYDGRLPYRVRVVVEPKKGLSYARNRAISEAKGEILAFLDDDGVADPGWLAGHVAAYDSDPEVKGVLGKIRPIWLAERPKWLDSSLEPFITIADFGDKPFEIEFPKLSLIGANMSFDRQALIEVGSFDPRFGFGGARQIPYEETELAGRMAAKGMKMVYWPGASIGHGVPPDRLTLRWFARRIISQGRAEALYDYEYRGKASMLKKALKLALFRGPVFTVVAGVDFLTGSRARAARRAAVLLSAYGYARGSADEMFSPQGRGLT